MSFNLIVTLAAREDTLHAVIYYESVQEEFGGDFLKDLEDWYAAICKNPFAYSYTDSKSILRDVSLNRFPFVIIFKVEGVSVIILSVHNIHKKSFS